MAKPIKMPKLSDQMTEGRLAEWLKREGDEVKAGDVLAQVETEKATLDIEAFESGVLLGLVVKVGESVAVGAPIAWIGARGEEVPSAGSAEPAPAAAKERSPGEAKEEPRREARREPPRGEASEAPPDEGREEGAGAGGEVSRPSTQRAAPRAAQSAEAPPQRGSRAAPAQTAARSAGERIVASPAARKVARERGVDLAEVEGSGPHGRVVLADLGEIAEEGRPPHPTSPPAARGERGGAPERERGAPERERGGAAEPTALAPGTPPPGSEHPAPSGPRRPPGPPARRGRALPPRAELRDETLPLSPMRRAIARNLAASKPGAPHFYLETSADARRLVALREQLEELDRGPVSVNDLVVKAVAEALARHPEVNSAWGADAIVRRGAVDVGIAVALDEGLVTPVVRGADRKDLFAVAAEIRDLAARARSRRLAPEEYQGASFTVSNLGMFGIEHFFAVINPPEAAILAVGAVMKVPWVDEATGALVAMERLRLGLSCDHRVVDGATGARYLQTLKAILEAPVRLVVG